MSSPKPPSPANAGSLNNDASRFKNMADAMAGSTLEGDESEYDGSMPWRRPPAPAPRCSRGSRRPRPRMQPRPSPRPRSGPSSRGRRMGPSRTRPCPSTCRAAPTQSGFPTASMSIGGMLQGGPRNAPPPGAPGNVAGGRNIGSGANKPKWTQEELANIAARCNTRVEVVRVTDTRRSSPDANKEFARIADHGTIVATMNSVLPRLDLFKIVIGIGNPRADEKLQRGSATPTSCAWTRAPRMINGRPERKIGEHFARFGFLKANIGPILETVNMVVPGVLENMSSTPRTGPGHQTSHLPSAMRMLGRSSSKGITTIAISATCDTKIVGAKTVPNNASGLGSSIKCHNFVHLAKVDWHGPPQSALTKPAVAQLMLAMAYLAPLKCICVGISSYENRTLPPFASAMSYSPSTCSGSTPSVQVLSQAMPITAGIMYALGVHDRARNAGQQHVPLEVHEMLRCSYMCSVMGIAFVNSCPMIVSNDAKRVRCSSMFAEWMGVHHRDPQECRWALTMKDVFRSFRGSADHVRYARTVNPAMLNVKINARSPIDDSITPSEIALREFVGIVHNPAPLPRLLEHHQIRQDIRLRPKRHLREHGRDGDAATKANELTGEIPMEVSQISLNPLETGQQQIYQPALPVLNGEEKKPVEEMILEDIEKAVTETTPVKVPPRDVRKHFSLITEVKMPAEGEEIPLVTIVSMHVVASRDARIASTIVLSSTLPTGAVDHGRDLAQDGARGGPDGGPHERAVELAVAGVRAQLLGLAVPVKVDVVVDDDLGGAHVDGHARAVSARLLLLPFTLYFTIFSDMRSVIAWNSDAEFVVHPGKEHSTNPGMIVSFLLHKPTAGIWGLDLQAQRPLLLADEDEDEGIYM
ncbi:hypothetical protein DL767_009490 [Monosporascus sp. MG133]|nr:hypothetical protein DL767_009490 [Monosporascus sp. MG133]